MNKKRILGILLFFLMIIGLFSTTAFADDEFVDDDNYVNLELSIGWLDQFDLDGIRPESVTVSFRQKGGGDVDYAVLHELDNYRDNPKVWYYDGDFEVWVENVPAGYTCTIDQQAFNRFHINMTHKHVHQYTKKEPSGEIYLVAHKTCTSGEIWRYACIACGAPSPNPEDVYEDGRPLGHDISSNARYTWSLNYYSCTANRACIRENCPGDENNGHIISETAYSTSEVTQSKTCTLPELIRYKVVFKDTAFGTKYETVETAPATGHDWDTPAYTWSLDHSTCTAQRVCKNDSTHVESETADSTSEVTQEKSGCDRPELTTYTANFTNEVFTRQTKEVTTAMVVHNWSRTTYTWQLTRGNCVASKVCLTNMDHTAFEQVLVVSEVTQEKTCTLPELTTYTAKFKSNGFGTRTKVEQTDEAIGHDWGEPVYIWSEDHSTCTAQRICKRDDTHIDAETVNSSSVITQEKTCEQPEIRIFTATFANSLYTAQTETNVKTAEALDHTWNDGVITKKATEQADGEKTYSCKNCTQKMTERIPKLEAATPADATPSTTTPSTTTPSSQDNSNSKQEGTAGVPQRKSTISVVEDSLKIQVKKSIKASQLISELTAGDYIQNVTTSNPKIVTVTKSGKDWVIKGKKAGSKPAVITIKLAGGASAEIRFTVQKAGIKTKKVTVENVKKKKQTLKAGETFHLDTVIHPVTATDKVKYSTSNKKIVTVNNKGKLTAKKAGKAAITITSGKKSYKLTVTVKKKAAQDFKLDKSKLKVKKKKSTALNVVFSPKNSEGKVEFTTSNKKIATVSASGKVKGIKKGKVTITATMTLPSGEKIVRTCKVTVK